MESWLITVLLGLLLSFYRVDMEKSKYENETVAKKI